MAEFVRIGKVSDIPEGERRWFDFEEETIVVFNINGNFYAIADVCTHDGGPLEDGEIDGYEVACPRHGARFDVRNGAAVQLPAVAPVRTYEIMIEGDDLFVENPDIW